MTKDTYVPVEARLRSAAGPGGTLVARRAAFEAGVSSSSWYERFADRRLVPVLGSVASFGALEDPIPRATLVEAAVLEGGPGAARFGTTALEQFGAWPDTRRDDTIHVASRRMHRPLPDRGVVFHRVDDEVAIVDHGGPCCTPAIAVLQAATQLTEHQLTFALRRLDYARLLRLEAFRQFVGASGPVRGIRTARRAIELFEGLSAGTKSRSEDRALGPLTGAFREPIVNVFGAAGIPDYEPDFVWSRERIIVEIDGGPHLDDPVTVARDRARDRILRNAGWVIHRVPWRDTFRMERVVAELRPVFASRRRDGR